MDVRQVGRGRAPVNELPEGRRPLARQTEAAAGEDLLESAVGGDALGEHQNGDPRMVCTGIQPHDRPVVAGDVPRQPEPGLDVVEVVGNRPVRREAGVVRIAAVEGGTRLHGDVRVPGALPAQAEVQGQPLIRLPCVLHKERGLVHEEVAQAQVVRRHPRHRPRLEVEQHRPRDVRPAGTCPGRVGRPVRTCHIAIPPGDEVDEAVDRVEDIAPVGKADELLGRTRPVVLDARLEQVAAG